MTTAPRTPEAQRLSKLRRHAVIAYAVVLTAVAVALLVLSNNSADSASRAAQAARQAHHNTITLERQGRTLHAAQYGNCHRANLSRINTNRNNYAGYRLWKATIALLQFDATQPKAPGSNPTPQSEALFTEFVTAMTTQLRSETWTPLYDCRAATDRPGKYMPPLAVPFSQTLPPLSAFTIGPNE